MRAGGPKMHKTAQVGLGQLVASHVRSLQDKQIDRGSSAVAENTLMVKSARCWFEKGNHMGSVSLCPRTLGEKVWCGYAMSSFSRERTKRLRLQSWTVYFYS